jgi:hypothetical protein
MMHLARHAIELLLRGKLFRDAGYFYQRLAIGLSLTVAMTLLASFAIKSLIVVALIGGFLGGAIQPYLFENVRYK